MHCEICKQNFERTLRARVCDDCYKEAPTWVKLLINNLSYTQKNIDHKYTKEYNITEGL